MITATATLQSAITVTAQLVSTQVGNCAAATVENNDQSYQTTVASGGLLTLPDITFTDSDGSSSSVPSVQDITATQCVSQSVSIALSDASPDWDDTLTITATATGFTPNNYAFYARNARETKLIQSGVSNTCDWDIDMTDTVTVFVIATDGTYTETESDSFTISGFITIWETWRGGTSNEDQITIPTLSTGSYNCDVYWSDGTSDLGITTYNDAAWTHTFPTNSERVWCRIEGDFEGWKFNYGGDKDKIVCIMQWGGMSLSTGNAGRAFGRCDNLTEVCALDAPLLGSGLPLNYLFNATALTFIDWTNWDISGTTQMISTLETVDNLTPENNIGFTDLDTSNIERFTSALWASIGGDLELRNIDWSSVTNASNFLILSDGTTIDDYDQTLQNILATSPIPSGVTFHFGGSRYTSGGAGETARTTLITTHGNTFTDGGAV